VSPQQLPGEILEFDLKNDRLLKGETGKFAVVIVKEVVCLSASLILHHPQINVQPCKYAYTIL
jgi:hypothetical protein